MTDSETELIRHAQAGDTEAFCSLAERYTRRIYLLALHYCHNSQDAEDLSQEVWLKAYQALSNFRSESSFYTWLRRITINTFLNHQRSGSFGPNRQTTTAELIDANSEESARLRVSCLTSEQSIYNKVLFESVKNALAELTPSQRLVFLLRHYEGMSYEEIASMLNCSTGTVKKAVWRAVGKLRAKLNATSDLPEDGMPLLSAEYSDGY